jgi:hypothetical protein
VPLVVFSRFGQSLFSGVVIHSTPSILTIQFTCRLTNNIFFISNVYGPSQPSEKASFVSWLKNIDTEALKVWLLMGNFNLIRSSDNRSAPGGSESEMLIFNDLINFHNWIDLPFTGRSFTWSLLVKLDWFFCSTDWLMAYPNTVVQPLPNQFLIMCPM